jgi:imidazoleglycerol phosphate synthase glutamine amidotransferase subunit HisH
VLGFIPEDDLVEALRTMGINQVKLTTTIEKWEQHQGREDAYYIKTYVSP